MATDLSDLDGVGPKTLSKLEAADYNDLDVLAKADPEDLETAGIGSAKAQKLIARAKQNAVLIQSAEEREQEYDERTVISTGIKEVDALIGGGLEEGVIVGAYGDTGSGKTQLGFNLLGHAVYQTGKPAVYIETERDRFRPERVRSLAPDKSIMDDIHVVRAYDLDQQLNAYRKVQNVFDDLSLVVVDSFTARFRLAERFDDRSELGQRSVEFKRHLNALESLVESTGTPIYLACQVYGNPKQYGANETIYGSSLFGHTATYYLHLKAASGDLRKVELENHPGQEEGEVHLNITDSEIIGLRK